MSGRARLALAATIGSAVWLAVAGCVSQDVADTVNRRLEHGISTSELKIANAAAYHAMRAEQARVLTARATVSEAASSAPPSPTPRPCTSGRLLHLTLVGYFPHARSSGAGDAPVTGQELTVDATTGRVCEKRYLTGRIMNDPMSVLLFSG